jgi:hypothetical protein
MIYRHRLPGSSRLFSDVPTANFAKGTKAAARKELIHVDGPHGVETLAVGGRSKRLIVTGHYLPALSQATPSR